MHSGRAQPGKTQPGGDITRKILNLEGHNLEEIQPGKGSTCKGCNSEETQPGRDRLLK